MELMVDNILITPIESIEQQNQNYEGTDISSEQKDLTDLQTKVETDNLKKEVVDSVEVNSYQTYELIQGSKMHDKLLTVLGSEKKVEIFALDIDKVVRKYLDQELNGFSHNIKNSMSVGIQFAMMETLIKQGVQGSTEFFNTFSTTNSGSATKAFDGLYKAFGKLGSANEFFVLANKVQNLTWFLSDKKNIITKSENILELMNPYNFKELLNQKIWSSQVQIDKLDITKILTLDSTTVVDIHEGEDTLKEIVNNDKISDVITEKSIASIQKSLKTADKLLDRREKFKDTASALVDKITSVLDINIPILGNLGSLMGFDFPTEILGDTDKDSGVLNFILGVLGFRGGVTGLHRKYIQEKLDELDIDTTFVSDVYNDFKKKISDTLTHDSPESIWKVCQLKASDTTKENIMKSKLPTDYSSLKKSLVKYLDSATLHPDMVFIFAPEYIRTDNYKNVVDTSKIADKDLFVDSYLKYIIPLLADPDGKMMKSPKVDADGFILAVIGGLVGDKYFMEGVNIGLLTPAEFKTTETDISQQTTTITDTPEVVDEILKKNIEAELDAKQSIITADMVISSSMKYKVPVEYIMAIMKNDSAYGTTGVGARTHNPGNVGNTDSGAIKDFGTWEKGVDAVAENLSQRIDEYKKIYGADKHPTLKELADNVGPDGNGFLSTQGNYKQKNTDRLGAYMTASSGGDTVQTISDALAGKSISNKDQIVVA